MVPVAPFPLSRIPDERPSLEPVLAGLSGEARDFVARALAYAGPHYGADRLSTGEPVLPHALGIGANLAAVGADPAARAAGILFAVTKKPEGGEALREQFGDEVAALATGVERLYRLRVATRPGQWTGAGGRSDRGGSSQTEVLRKMVLGMVEDIRVVLIRLASRTQTLRWFTRNDAPERRSYAQETLDLYAPLANRLGVWQLKWELEDLSFRFVEPEAYARIAGLLDEKRGERERYVEEAVRLLDERLRAAELAAQVTGRPKHIYSIWNKMRGKGLGFAQIHDVRGLRVIVKDVKACYAALGVVHDLWSPLPQEFDDYISRPKGNDYQSLHTAVEGPGGKTLEVQIRTEAMHRQAEFGIAAHWRYKEGAERGGRGADTAFEERIVLLRQLLAWRDEVASGGARDRAEAPTAAQDDTIYALTPQGRVIDLPAGATAIDFAYALHTDLGHRCRGAKVDGQIVPLDRVLKSGERVEIVAAKSGGPSRDWLSAERRFVKSPRARQKIRQWFNAQAHGELVASGRELVERELRREGASHTGLEALAARLGFDGAEDLFVAAARDEVNLRQLHGAMRSSGEPAAPPAAAPVAAPARRESTSSGGVLVVGLDRLLTQLARCCKPVPPDPVRGFVTRGRGVSVHREDCASLQRLAERDPERLVEVTWGAHAGGEYAVEIVVAAGDRPGLLRDLGDALARERINVTSVRTQSRDDIAFMRFAFRVSDAGQLRRALAAVKTVQGVIRAARG